MRVKKTTASISGFGGGYEDTCQRMLWKGVAYLAEVKPPLSIWEKVTAYQNVYGVLNTKGEGIKALESAAMAGEDDVTGAIHQAVMQHLYQIHRNSADWWVEHLRDRDPARIFEWEGELMPSGGGGT